MKRSEINRIIEESIEFFNAHQFILPQYGYFKLEDWGKTSGDTSEIFDLGLGWDITDLGSGDFRKCGLVLFTIRNGDLSSTKYLKPYAEKIMIQKKDQITPMHFHSQKMEDIINRGGGTLAVQVFLADERNELSETDVQLSTDGVSKTYKAGSWIHLQPGQSITLSQRIYHTFHAKNEDVLIGEVSMVNDDYNDNVFLEEIGRFPEIEENVAPTYLLVNDYKKYLNI